jgi:integrase
MPLKLIPPRKDKTSKNFYIRGTYLGKFVNRSAGASERKTALQELRRIEGEIERGRYAQADEPTFGEAVKTYLDAGGDPRWINPLLDHFEHSALSEIDQRQIDNAAATLYPAASPATRNRQVYTPMSAILKRSGVAFALRRPKDSNGRTINAWLRQEQAERMFAEAGKIDPEFRIFLRFLCYTGCRLSEATSRFLTDNLDLRDASAFIPRTKNGKPRKVHLPPHIVVDLANHPRGLDRPGETVFRWSKGGALYDLLRDTAKAADVRLPKRAAFHLFRHTYATWLRRFAGADARALVGTGAWDSERSANRYAHTVTDEDARLADLLPVGKSLETKTKRKIAQ